MEIWKYLLQLQLHLFIEIKVTDPKYKKGWANKKSYSLLAKINYRQSLSQIGTSKRYKSVLNHLINYWDQRERVDILFNGIDALFIREFDAYLSL